MTDSDERLLAAARGISNDSVGTPDEQAFEHAVLRIGNAARSGLAHESLIAPPKDLWQSIALAIDSPMHDAVPETHSAQDHRVRDEAPPQSENVVPIGQHRRPFAKKYAALLIAASLIAVTAAGILTLRRGDTNDTVIERAVLKPLGTNADGEVALIRHNGRLELRVNAKLPPRPGHYYELWLANRKVSGLVSLGPLEPGRLYNLPPGMQLNRFPLVDVSIEAEDGNPLHSSKSVLRGDLGDTLRTA